MLQRRAYEVVGNNIMVENESARQPKSTAYLCLGPRRTPGGQDSTKTTRKKVSRKDPQVGFVIQAWSDALLGGNFG